MNIIVDEENGKAVGVVKVRPRRDWPFSINEFWKNIGCLISASTFGIGGSRIWDKEESHKIGEMKINRLLIMVKVNFYAFCVYHILFKVLFIILLLYWHPFFSPYLWHISHQGKQVQEVLAKMIRFWRGQGIWWMVEVKVIDRLIRWGMQEYSFQLYEGWRWVNECDSFSYYIKGGPYLTCPIFSTIHNRLGQSSRMCTVLLIGTWSSFVYIKVSKGWRIESDICILGKHQPVQRGWWKIKGVISDNRKKGYQILFSFWKLVLFK